MRLMAEIQTSPALVALAQMSDIAPERMAAAFSDPLHFFEHLTLEELARLQETCGHFASVQTQMLNAVEIYRAYAEGFLKGRADPKSAPKVKKHLVK
jgi:hypothetical protein